MACPEYNTIDIRFFYFFIVIRHPHRIGSSTVREWPRKKNKSQLSKKKKIGNMPTVNLVFRYLNFGLAPPPTSKPTE